MKTIISRESGKKSYGSKWQTTESSSDSESDEKSTQSPNLQDNANQIIAQVGSNETAAQASTIEAAELQSPTIPQAAKMHTRIISRDKDGNNILHLAAKLYVNRAKSNPASLLQRELIWFSVTRRVVPPSYQDMMNNDGLTPRELFSKTHRKMVNDGKMWMMNSADSYMLIATILISVVFAAAFALPGGYDPQTGKPVLFAAEEFKGFLRCELYGLVGSVISILLFRSIMTSRFAEDDFLVDLPLRMLLGFQILLMSLMLAIASFLSSFEMLGKNLYDVDMLFGIVVLYAASVLWFVRELTITFSWVIVYVVRKLTPPDSFQPSY